MAPVTRRGESQYKPRLRAARAVTAALLAMCLADGAAAAPPPPPTAENNLGAIKAREAMQQMRRFEDAGLPIPAPPTNGGMCVIDTSGSYAQSGASGTYRLYEIQRWEVSTAPMQSGQNPLTYAVQWSTIGNGERHEDNGVGTRNDWTYAISAASGTQMRATKLASNGTWLIQVAPVSVPNGVAVTQQQTVSGIARNPGTTHSVASAFGYPSMNAAPPAAGSPPGTLTTFTERKSWLVPQNIGWGYPQPGYARGTIGCVWTLAVGP
jgi:hypothetical protein